MKRESVYSITELLVILIDHLLVYPVAVLFVELFMASDTGLTEMTLKLPYGGTKSWGAVLLVWIALYILYAVFFFIKKYIKKIDGQGRTKRAINPAFDAVILVVCMYLSNGTDMLWWPGLVQFIFVCGLYVIFLYMCHYQEFLMVSDGDVGKSATFSVLKTGFVTVLIFDFLIVVILTAIACIPAVRGLIDSFVTWLGGLFALGLTNSDANNTTIINSEAVQSSAAVGEDLVVPLWLSVFEMVAAIVVTVLTVIGTYMLLRLVVSSIVDAIKSKKPDTIELDERIIDDVTDEVESLAVKGRGGLRGLIAGLNQTPAQKIRRLYKKYVVTNREFIEKELSGATVEKSTAREVVTVGTVSNDVIELYEKARYSQEDVTAEDYKKMKLFMK